MKKIIAFIAIFTMVFGLSACGKNSEKEVIGTWYSTRPDTLVIEKKGKFTSEWLTSGLESNYKIKDNIITFTAPDGQKYEFEINKDNTLSYNGNGLSFTYYTDKKHVDSLIAEAEEKAEAEVVEKEIEYNSNISTLLIGKWEWVGIGSIIEFTFDGKYLFTNYQDNVWDYEIIDSETLSITKDTGESYNAKISIIETEDGFELSFSNGVYIKK